MDQPLKQRLIGAAVLAALAVIFLPMLLKGPDVHAPDAAEVPLSMPATPGQDFETRELPLTVPEPAPAGGVLGMESSPPATTTAATSVPAGGNTVPEDAVAPVEAPSASSASATPAPAPAPATAPATVALPPAKPGSEGPATGGGAYVVNIGSFANRANAASLAAKLHAAGLPVLSEPVKIATGDATRLRVGPYADRAAGEAARLRAQSAANVSGTVIALDAAPAKPAAAVPPPAKPAIASPAAATPAVATAASPAKPAPTKPATPAATPAASPATSPAPAAAASAGFAVQLSAPAAESDANALRDRARAAGLPSFVQRIDTDSGVRYRVRVGPYADRASAEAALAGVNAKLGTHGIVMRHP